ncbi:MAG: PAS domain S-box protein [bacterium]
MDNPLQVLIVEDSKVDALIVVKELERGGFEPRYQRVESAPEMETALELQTWDVILADYMIPDFGGLEALKMVQARELDIPFIMISGKMGEEFAVEAMRAGVHDYIVKGNLSRLTPAIRRELKEAETRRRRRKAEAALRESEERLKATFEQAAVGIAHLDKAGKFLRINQKLADILGYSENELLSMDMRSITNPEDQDIDQEQINQILDGDLRTHSVEKRLYRKNRSEVWVNLTFSVVMETPGEPKYLISVIEDISRRKRSERALRESERKFRFVFEGASIGIALIDLQGEIARCNIAFSNMLDFDRKEILGMNFSRFTHPDDLIPERELHERLLSGRLDQYQIEKRLFRRDGQMIWGRSNVSLIHDFQGNPEFALVMIEDVTNRKFAEEKIQYMALYDAITDLPNRSLFLDRMHQAVSRAHRNQSLFALLFIDLDHFKEINDKHGHSAGDRVLREVAIRLKQCIRETDTACRLGGDEFAIILQDIQEIAYAEKIAQKIIRSISQPFVINDSISRLGTSIGVSFYPFDGEEVDVLLKNADFAMYTVKKSTRNNYFLYCNKISA